MQLLTGYVTLPWKGCKAHAQAACDNKRELQQGMDGGMERAAGMGWREGGREKHKSSTSETAQELARGESCSETDRTTESRAELERKGRGKEHGR